MKAYEEIKFPHGYIRWIREGNEYVCRMSEEVMNEIKTQHEKEWVGLTPEEAKEISLANRPYVIDMIAALEKRLKEKNT